jgi:hypothetical protein
MRGASKMFWSLQLALNDEKVSISERSVRNHPAGALVINGRQHQVAVEPSDTTGAPPQTPAPFSESFAATRNPDLNQKWFSHPAEK